MHACDCAMWLSCDCNAPARLSVGPARTSEVELDELDDEEERLEEALWKKRAFPNQMDAKTKRAAAEFADEWFATDEGNRFRAYYVCMGGGAGNECCTVILSETWTRLHADPMVRGQRYYCHCGTKYVT